MTRAEIFDYAERHGSTVIFTDLTENEAMSVEVGGEHYIGLDTMTPESSEKELIAHELGHCEYAGFYSRYTPMATRERIEYRARKWQFLHLIPLGELRDVLRHGITAPWELAEHFGVSELFVLNACEYYTNACGAIMEEDAV